MNESNTYLRQLGDNTTCTSIVRNPTTNIELYGENYYKVG